MRIHILADLSHLGRRGGGVWGADLAPDYGVDCQPQKQILLLLVKRLCENAFFDDLLKKLRGLRAGNGKGMIQQAKAVSLYLESCRNAGYT